MKRVAALTLAAAALCAAARADSGPVPLARVSLGEIGGWIAMDVELGGQTGRWLIDTGASRNLVSPALAQRLGLAPRGAVVADTVLGPLRGGEVSLPALRLGGFERPGQTALVLELSTLIGAAAEGIDGVLGVPLLDGVQLDLDLRQWLARFGRSDTADCPDGTQPVALTRHRTLPVIRVAVGEPAVDEAYVLDTGNPAALLRVEASAADAATPGLALPGGHRLTLLPRATIGPQIRSSVPVLRVAAPALVKGFDGKLRGLAGTAFIDGARWRLDLARNRLCVEAGSVATPGGFGLALERRGSELRLSAVLAGSPAAHAGLREGDVVTRWPGGDTGRPLTALWAALQGRDEIVVGVGEPPRELTLRRALFAPPAEP
jgi:Aspartyl protease